MRLQVKQPPSLFRAEAKLLLDTANIAEVIAELPASMVSETDSKSLADAAEVLKAAAIKFGGKYFNEKGGWVLTPKEKAANDSIPG